MFYVLAYLGFAAPLARASLARAVGSTATLLGPAAVALAALLLPWLDRAGERPPA